MPERDDFRRLLEGGVSKWNKWRDRERLRKARRHLAPSDLEDMVYVRAWALDMRVPAPWLGEADLQEQNLEGIDLAGADLWKANFSSSNLRGANLDGASLLNANLAGADLREASLWGADLTRVNLECTLFENAILGSTIFGNLDTRNALALGSARHHGPSIIDVATIFRSKGALPIPFLRGAGLPDDFIAYVDALVSRPIEFYSCFISYSTADQVFASRLFADLQQNGIRCWFAPHDIKGGIKLYEQIESAIRQYDRLLLILSAASMSSAWVHTEIAEARAREIAERRRVLFPISITDFESVRNWRCFDADLGIDSARSVREYFIPDFSAWRDDAEYQHALQRLVRDLKISDG